MSIFQAIAWKDWPGRQWPLWSHSYHFALDSAFTWEQSQTWTDDIRRWERLIHDGRVNHRLCGWWKMDADADGGAASCWFHPIIQGVPGDARELANPCDWHVALRLRHSDGVQRPGARMYRGAVSEEQILRDTVGQVGLLEREALQTLLLGDQRKMAGEIFQTLLIHHKNPIGPGYDWTGVEYVDVAGVTLLNAQRRAMARHLSGAVSTLAAVVEKLEMWYALTELWYATWYLLDLPEYYPIGIKEQIVQANQYAAGYAQLVKNFFEDIDPDTPGNEDDTGRFGMTGAFIVAEATKLLTKYDAWTEEINHEVPFLFGTELFWHNSQMKKFWGETRQWNQHLAPGLFWDWMDSTRATDQSKVRGGYVPLHPEIDPAN